MADSSGRKREFVSPNKASNGQNLSGPAVEMMLEGQRRSVETMAQASRLIFDGVLAIWCRQLDFVQEAVGELATLMSDFTQPTGPLAEGFAKQAEYSKKVFVNACEISELTTWATKDAINLINRRFSEGFGQVHRTHETPETVGQRATS